MEENYPTEEESSLSKEVKSTFMRRLIALLIDFIALGLFGYLLGLLFTPFFALMGPHGVLVGWFISSIYFALGNSNLLGGQTLGKSLLDLKVVNSMGQTLELKNGFKRSLAFTTPFFLLEYFGGIITLPEYLQYTIEASVFAYYIGLLYFFIVNTKSRQTLHDIFAKTLVIRSNQAIDAIPQSISKSKKIGYIGTVVTFVLLFIGIFITINKNTGLLEVFEANKSVLLEIAREAGENENILSVESSKIHISDEGVGIKLEVWTKNDIDEIDTDSLYSQLNETLKGKTFNISRLDYIEIILKYGYDIGIADYKRTKSWKKEIGYEDEIETEKKTFSEIKKLSQPKLRLMLQVIAQNRNGRMMHHLLGITSKQQT